MKIFWIKRLIFIVLIIISSDLALISCKNNAGEELTNGFIEVKIKDNFWGPRFDQWRTTTVHDVFNKFEGNYNPAVDVHLENDFKNLGATRDAFKNFDRVAAGERGTGKHNGPPWYDGLIYETIRGASDFLGRYPDENLEKRIDGYIDRIAAAQNNDPDGYLNTYTQLVEPDHRWGFNGGMLRWQHDVYNAGMLIEAAVHYYKATGKTKLLGVAVKYTNYMCQEMGPAPKKNIVPAHSGPEEAAIKMYWLFKNEPELKEKLDVPVDEKKYYELATFWLENRGHHVGFPLWKTWGNAEAEKWIKEVNYDDPRYGEHRRPTWGDYAQDSIPVFQQRTIEGHAVRATLMATGLATTAIENKDTRYIETATALWNNMVGNRMFITGGVGAIADDEKFGSDFYLPNNAYLETCAAVGAGFFSQRMNQLLQHGKYMDEFERVLYNNVLTGISVEGDHYTYQNPLNADHHHRWEWHDCPCCPPMFLKMVSAVPDFIYLYSNDAIYVNLFAGNESTINHNNQKIFLKMVTDYPWDGGVNLQVTPESPIQLSIKVRIPGWSMGQENPFGLYHSNPDMRPVLKVNGESVDITLVDGYVTINRIWKKGDEIDLKLPMKPRLIYAKEEVRELNGQAAIASGPIIYSLEGNQNSRLASLRINKDSPMEIKFNAVFLGGINVITGRGVVESNEDIQFSAIPYFSIGNIKSGDAYKVWVNTN